MILGVLLVIALILIVAFIVVRRRINQPSKPNSNTKESPSLLSPKSEANKLCKKKSDTSSGQAVLLCEEHSPSSLNPDILPICRESGLDISQTDVQIEIAPQSLQAIPRLPKSASFDSQASDKSGLKSSKTKKYATSQLEKIAQNESLNEKASLSDLHCYEEESPLGSQDRLLSKSKDNTSDELWEHKYAKPIILQVS